MFAFVSGNFCTCITVWVSFMATSFVFQYYGQDGDNPWCSWQLQGPCQVKLLQETSPSCSGLGMPHYLLCEMLEMHRSLWDPRDEDCARCKLVDKLFRNWGLCILQWPAWLEEKLLLQCFSNENYEKYIQSINANLVLRLQRLFAKYVTLSL